MEQYKYTIPGSVVFDGNTEITKLPGSHEIEGILSLQHCPALRELPEALSVGWDLDISYSGVESFPESMWVGYAIDANHSQLRSVATLDHTQGDLILSHCERLEEMPRLLVVNGDLDLTYCTRLKQLPQKLLVRGNLYLDHSAVTSLPEHLLVGGDLSLSGTPLTELPVGLKVGGYLNLSDCTQLTKLPSQLTVRTFLNLYHSAIESFMDTEGLHVGGIVVSPTGSLITNNDGQMKAIPNPDDDYTPDFLLRQSRILPDAMFMGNDHFVSYDNQLWRIYYTRNNLYFLEELCPDEDDLTLLYKGDDGHYRLECPLKMPTDEFSSEWFGEAFRLF